MATDKKPTTTATSVKTSNTRSRRPPNHPTVQNFHLVWLDESIDEVNNDDCRNSITKLREVVNTINTFTDVDECIDFITDVERGTALMMVSESFSKIIGPVVQDIYQASSVYIYSENKMPHEKWTKQWLKVEDVNKDITSICVVLKQAAKDCDHNSLSISFVKPSDEVSNRNLDQLDSSFMYTQLLKEILLNIDFEQEHINEFITYCREQFVGNISQLRNIEKIEKEYVSHQPIWWYTYEYILYSMVNKALRFMEVDLIIKMGFFVRDLHNHIATLHAEQYGGHHNSDSFTVYRGQGMFHTDFSQLMNTQGGLLSFNNFLSTSSDRLVSLAFAQSNQDNPDLIGILFQITINPSIFSSPFAKVGNVSHFNEEEEILFSMHSVFRIGQIKQIDGNDRLWQVDLTLTDDNDPQLHVLTERIREETFPQQKGWYRLGNLLLKLGQFEKAQQVSDIMLRQTTDQSEKGSIYNMLGNAKNGQGNYVEANGFYEKALEILEKTLPPNYLDLATSYNNIGEANMKMSEYSKARSSYEKALEIYQKTLPTYHLQLATPYNNIGELHKNMGEYSEALRYQGKALEIYQKSLPANHPDLATSYNNIGNVYIHMGEYPKAISYFEKAFEIYQKTLPPNHPDLATSYSNIAAVYYSMSEYSKALSYFEKALEILQKNLPANHSLIASSYNNIGVVYKNMSEYSKALPYHEIALEIREKTLPENHPDLTTSYNNIGLVYKNMGEYSKALSYYEKALQIEQKTVPPNHSDLATSYNNIGAVYNDMGEYSKAVPYYEKALAIREKNSS